MTAASSLAVVGAGPVGIDAAIAGVEAGYAVTVYEQGPAVAANVREWGHVQLFTPWDMSLSSRARRRVPGLPVGQACPSGAELAEVIQRLASSLPPGTVRLGMRIDSIARSGVVKSDVSDMSSVRSAWRSPAGTRLAASLGWRRSPVG